MSSHTVLPLVRSAHDLLEETLKDGVTVSEPGDIVRLPARLLRDLILSTLHPTRLDYTLMVSTGSPRGCAGVHVEQPGIHRRRYRAILPGDLVQLNLGSLLRDTESVRLSAILTDIFQSREPDRFPHFVVLFMCVVDDMYRVVKIIPR